LGVAEIEAEGRIMFIKALKPDGDQR
jgi:hypothetical protein